MAAVLAARGGSCQRRVVLGERDTSGKLGAHAPVPSPGATGVSEGDWALILRGMVGATTYGTAAAIGKDRRYAIAGKTGTAQVYTVGQNARYNEKTVAERLRDHAWFIGFAPAEAPRIAVCVLVENGGFGASAAAPIARRVMDAYLLDGVPATAATATTATATTATATATATAATAPAAG